MNQDMVKKFMDLQNKHREEVRTMKEMIDNLEF